MTIGAERPPYGTRKRKFWPLCVHFSTRPVSFEVTARFGPRGSGQSPSATPSDAAVGAGRCADAQRPAAATSANMRVVCFRIIMIDASTVTQKLTPARRPNVRGAPLSPTTPDGDRPGYGIATGI